MAAAYAGKTAVVTGAASGIGRAIARHAVELGCNVILADVEEDALEAAARQLGDTGGTVMAVRTDVSDAADVEALARSTTARFAEVHLLFNNAGVGVAGPRSWERTLDDWRWVLGVNLWGVIHGLHAFLPIMMRQSSELAHIVNTASAAGLMSPPGMAPYTVSKHGVVALTEVLHHDLGRGRGAPMRTHRLRPSHDGGLDAHGDGPLAPCFVADRSGRSWAMERGYRARGGGDAATVRWADMVPSAASPGRSRTLRWRAGRTAAGAAGGTARPRERNPGTGSGRAAGRRSDRGGAATRGTRTSTTRMTTGYER